MFYGYDLFLEVYRLQGENIAVSKIYYFLPILFYCPLPEFSLSGIKTYLSTHLYCIET